MKKLFSRISVEWNRKNTLQKIERMLSYTILAALIMAVVPAITLQIQLSEFQKTLAEQNLSQCEQQISTQSITSDIKVEEEVLYPSAPESKNVNLVLTYFDAFNRNDMITACDIISDAKCVAQNPVDIKRYESLRNNMVQGYENIHIWESDKDQRFHSDVICVQYDYTYKNDVNAKKVTEMLSYYVKDNEITARVCEKMMFNGETEVPCPIISKTDFCR